MIIRLLPEQVVKWWDYIRFAIKEAAPSGYFSANEILNNILESLLLGDMQCWFVVADEKEEFELLACAVTRIHQEPTTKERIFTLFVLYGYDVLDMTSWKSAMESAVKFAVLNKCTVFDAYTDSDEIVNLAKKAGFKNKHYLFMELPK